jgi:hypothetical protein
MKDKFLKLSRGKQIALAVFLVHFVAIVALLGHHFATRQLRPPRPMVVRTLAAQPAPVAIVSAPAVAKTTTPTKPKATPVTPVKKVAPPVVINKTTTKPVAKPAPVVVQKKDPVLQEIAESLEALSTEATRTRTQITVPSKRAAKAEIAPSKLDPTYGEILIAYLQNELDLPEYGEVRARIEIDRFGCLVGCEILESKSAKNAEFLKNRLPELAFPCLNDAGIFTITFRNVEIR